MPKIRVQVTPWQGRFLVDRSRYKAVVGGVGSGKSVCVGEDFIRALTEAPRSQSLLILGTYKQLREGALVTLKSRLSHHFGPEGVGWTQNKSDLSITIRRGPPAGHRIVMWSAESYEGLKSAEYDFVWCDEVQTWEYPDKALAYLFTRQRSSPAAVEAYSQRDEIGDIVPDTCSLKWRMWISANPPWTTAHYLYQRFVEKRDPADPFSFYHVRTIDNTLLPNREEYIEGLRRELPADVFRVEVLGEWGDIGVGRAYTSFYRERAIKPDPRLPSLVRNPDGSLWTDATGRPRIALDPMRALVWTQDFGVNPRASVIGQVHPLPAPIPGFQRTLVYWLDAIEIPNGSTDLMIQEFVRRYSAEVVDAHGGRHKRKIFVYGDPAGRTRNSTTAESDWAYMKQHPLLKPYAIEYVYDAASPHVVDRIASTNAKLCNAADEIGALFDPGDGADRPAAGPLMSDLQKTRWKQGTRLLDKGSPQKGIFHTHLSDAMGYFTVKEFPIRVKSGVRVVGAGATAR